MTGFFYAGLTMFLILFMYWMLPETRNRSFAELHVLFENNVSARQFHKINVDQFAFQHEVKVDYASHMTRSVEGIGVAV
jgi:SP family general alpha glucoside:H+ symporter-like MFS transporter